MKEESSVVNAEAGKILGDAIKSHPLKQKGVAEKLSISTKQLQNYSKGIFPRFKNDKIIELDKMLGTNIFALVYQGEKSEPEVLVNPEDESDLKKAIRELSESARLHIVIEDRNSRSIERLITLLEMKIGVKVDDKMELPEIGSNGNVVDIREKAKKNQPKK